jgi:lysophospholipase
MRLSLAVALAILGPALVDAQSVGAAYTPGSAPCPSGTELIRSVAPGGNISDLESAYIARRAGSVNTAKNTYLSNLAAYASKNLPGVSIPEYLKNGSNITPKLGIALSGGGHRAAIFGLSVVNLLDGRNDSSANAGFGGVLQLSRYISGLSGGAWALTSMVQANFPSVPEVFFGPSTPPPNNQSGDGVWGGWNADIDIIPVNLPFVQSLLTGLGGKARQFPVTFTDLWALGLARHFVNGTTEASFFETTGEHGAGVDFSDLAELYVPNPPSPIDPILSFHVALPLDLGICLSRSYYSTRVTKTRQCKGHQTTSSIP